MVDAIRDFRPWSPISHSCPWAIRSYNPSYESFIDARPGLRTVERFALKPSTLVDRLRCQSGGFGQPAPRAKAYVFG